MNREDLETTLAERRVRDCIWIRKRLGKSVKDGIEPEDIFQNAASRALAALDQLRGDTPTVFSAWFAAVLRREIAQELRRVRSLKRGDGWIRVRRMRMENASSTTLLGHLPAAHHTPSGQAGMKEAVIRLVKAVKVLPALRRRVILMKYQESKTNEEIAVVIGRSPDAVRGLIHHALNDLRGILVSDSLSTKPLCDMDEP